MPAEQVIVKAGMPSGINLPGTLRLPDGTRPVRMGSGIITSLISSGGMAIVYEIWNPELEVKRAVKLLHPDHTKESEERFYTEMKITAKLHHPNIVEIYSVGRWNELPFIEMERIEGVTLQSLLTECCRMPPEVCTAIGIVVGRALNYSHNQDYVLYGRKYHGIIHRDLKPGNVMITHEGVVKLMDFGIARPMTASIHTCEGTVIGTMQYLAPEQLDGTVTDARADLYSLGCVMYEMLTGVRAFPELNIARLVPEKLSNTFAPLDQFSIKIPPALTNLIHKCMRHDKERRVQNALEFLRMLGNIHSTLTDDPPEKVIARFMHDTRQYRNAARRRKRVRIWTGVIWAGGILAVVLTAMLGTQFLLGSGGDIFRGMAGRAGSTASSQNATPPTTPLESTRETPAEPAVTNQAPRPTSEEGAAPTPPTEHRPARGDPSAAATVASASRVTFSDRLPARTRVPAASPTGATSRSDRPRVPSAVSEVAPPAGSPGTAAPSLLEQLSAQYQTANVMAIFTSEVEKGRFQNALELYPRLKPADAAAPKAILYRLRAARGLSQWKTVTDILNSADLRDAEFYLEKAMQAYRARDLAAAQRLLEQAGSMPAAYLDQDALRQSLLYGRALCASAVFDKSASPQDKQQAMSAWYELKSLLRSNPEHRYFQKADEEIRRINRTEAGP